MKKSILLLSLSFYFFSSVNAQITKGSIFLGGDIGASTQKSESMSVLNKQSGFSISPVVGKAIRENLVFGIELSYAFSKTQYTDQEQKINSYGSGIFLRKYKPIGKSGFYIFLHGRAAYRHT